MRAIFIGGCGRSGTTMLGGMLGASSNSFATPESHFKVHFLQPHNSFIREDLKQNFSFKNWRIDLGLMQESLSLEDILTSYKKTHNIDPSKNIWIDHTPENFRICDLLLNEFNDAKFIHIVRDPRAIANSIINLEWGPNNAYQAAKWWVENISYGLHTQIKYPSKVMMVKYEDLVNEPRQTMESISEFVNLPIEDSMFQGEATFLPGFTKKQHKLVGQAPDKAKITEWQTKLSARQISEIENVCQAHLRLFGYETDLTLKVKSYQPKDNFKNAITDFLSYVLKLKKNRRRKKING